MKSALIATLSFVFIATQAIASSADDQSIPPGASTDHRWVLWKIIQNPTHPYGIRLDLFPSEKECRMAREIKYKILPEMENSDSENNSSPIVCLKNGVDPIFDPADQHALHNVAPSKPSSPSDNGHD